MNIIPLAFLELDQNTTNHLNLIKVGFHHEIWGLNMIVLMAWFWNSLNP
jgi:hypothetical protein